MSVSKVYMICVAYEQGVGQSDRDLPNPYSPDSDENEAYAIGVEEGEKMRKNS